MNTKLFLLLGTSLSFIPALTFAQCVATQDCATLGYTETSCSGSKGIKCPFGNKWACFSAEITPAQCTELGFTYSCTGTGYSGGASQPCNGKYNYCTCSSGYEWKNGTCKIPYIDCKIGTLFYSDNTCSSNKISGKTLLGVVIMEKTASTSGWIMTVKPIATGIAWDTGSYFKTGITDKNANASCTNTQKLLAFGSRSAAANAANNYKPSGTPSNTSWCLPAYDVLNNINNSTNFAKINAGISTAGGKKIGFGTSASFENIWSSSERDYEDDYEDEYYIRSSWAFHASTDGSFDMRQNFKYSTDEWCSVRPVLAF